MRSRIGWIGLVCGIACVMLSTLAHAGELTWWSQWSVEENKKTVLFEVKKRFEAAHPGTKVTLTFYEKANMFPPLRATMAANSGFPDVFTMDTDHAEYIEAGWTADLAKGIRWESGAVRQGCLDPTGAWRQDGPLGPHGRVAFGRALLQ